MWILMLVICVSIIVIHFCIGYRNVKRLEVVCSEVVTARITTAEKHRFIGCNYYGLVLNYSYDGKDYSIKKALFKEVGNMKEISLHINPNNPVDCYMVPIRERCKMCAGL